MHEAVNCCCDLLLVVWVLVGHFFVIKRGFCRYTS
jgi:hypothetical protein